MRIGAVHADVTRTAGSFDLAGSTAIVTGRQAAVTAAELETELASLDRLLTEQVGQLVAALEQQVAAHQAGLQTADWEGASRTEAMRHAEHLQQEVQTVLTGAQELVAAFAAATRTQVAAYRGSIESELQVVLAQADQHYATLADAARRFAAGLQAADATIGR